MTKSHRPRKLFSVIITTMQTFFSFNFLNKCLKNIQKDLLVCKTWLYISLFSFFGFVLFLLEFSFIKMVFSKIRNPLFLYFVGTIFTSFSNYLVIFMSFLPIKYVFPVYALSFIYMLLI